METLNKKNEFVIDDINENALYILKVNEQGRFETDYLKVNDELANELNYYSLYNFLKEYTYVKDEPYSISYNKKSDAVMAFFLMVYDKYKFLYSWRDYCPNGTLRSSYCEFKPISEPDDLEKTEYSNSTYPYHFIHLKRFNLTTWSYKYIHDFLFSYFLEQSYDECKSNQNIKAYSHRHVGWTSYKYQLNDKLSVQIATNFGYGHSCYFLVTLIYDDILIIPYSRLVIYYYAETSQLIRHTREYDVSDQSWAYALDFVKDACNDLIDNGTDSFISKYMISECERLIEILPSFLEYDEFSLSDNKYGKYGIEEKTIEVKLDGINLMLFRGEKISGAINYTDNIKKLNKIIPTVKYIDCINSCCNKAEPMLKEAISIYTNYLDELIQKIHLIECQLEKISEEFVPINLRKQEFIKIEIDKRHELLYSNKDNSETSSIIYSDIYEFIKNYMTSTFSDYELVIQTHTDLEKEKSKQNGICYNLQNEKFTLEGNLRSLNTYYKNILSYLSTLSKD